MVGGGGRREETLVLNSTNVFAALGSLKKKKNSEKDRVSEKTKKHQQSEKEPEKEVFWAPAPLTVKSWADVDDDDDDDYYATTAPPKAVWANATEPEVTVEESETEEGVIDEVDDDVEIDDHGNDSEIPVEIEHIRMIVSEISSAPKEAERQLSKKELKKKEFAELEAVLAEFGYGKSDDTGPENSLGDGKDKKAENLDGGADKKDNLAGENKNLKKKKKEKSSKEQKGSENYADSSDISNVTDDVNGSEKIGSSSAINVKEKLKNVVSNKKKKPTKEISIAARVAATEAAARSAKLAAATKKKQKNHYDQQPLR